MLRLKVTLTVVIVGIVVQFGIGNDVEEPCQSDSNCTALHSHCSQDFQVCTCPVDYPVRVNISLCAKQTKLLEPCFDDSTCQYVDPNAVCRVNINKCMCKRDYKEEMIISEIACVQIDSDESDEEDDDSKDDDADYDADPLLRKLNRSTDPAPIIAGAVLAGVVVLACSIGCYQHIAKSMERRRRLKRYIDDQLKAIQNQHHNESTTDTRWIEMIPLNAAEGNRNTSTRPDRVSSNTPGQYENMQLRRTLLPNVPEEPECPPTYEEAIFEEPTPPSATTEKC